MNPIFTVFIIIVVILLVINKKTPGIKGSVVQGIFINQKKILENHFIYFKNLSEPDKKEFIRRINITIGNKYFIPKQDFYITQTMKTLISGSLVQLTFGMENFVLPAYNTIYVYPDAFENHRTGKMHRGETNTNGYVSISWKHFIYGYNIPNDRLNVGLHEMAHALLNTIIFSNIHDPNLDDKLILLDKIPDTERSNLFAGEHPFFRDYARTNIKEFFAVSIECFFETPNDFARDYPEFYKFMANLLNQDPASGTYRNYKRISA